MTTGEAIAAVTRTLQALLVGATPNVSMMPLDKARDGAAAGEQLNLFLYNTPVAAAFRNSDAAGLRPGESGFPPLPLSMHYLITAYGPDEAAAHRVLGAAMAILHDHMLLSPQEIRDANPNDQAAGLDTQAERVRITPLPLSPHDMFELWSGFATSYRVSAAYEASVVLIDSVKPRRTPLPVLRRGPTAVTGGAPDITTVLPPARATISTLGTTATVVGSNLGSITGIELTHPLLVTVKKLSPDVLNDKECQVQLPGDAAAALSWPAGFYDVQAVTERAEQPRLVSKTRSMGLGPTITVTSPTAPVPAGDVTVEVECTPQIHPGQTVQMMLDSHDAAELTVTTPPPPAHHSVVSATFTQVISGTYTVRLRVDRADSDPVSYTGSPPVPRFDPAVQVVVV